MKNVLARTIDHGFYLSFAVDVDLTTMTAARVAILRPDNTVFYRDLAAGTWNTLGVGDTLNVLIAAGDYTLKGAYVFQVFVRRMNAAVEEVAFSSQAFKMNVDDPIIAEPWA